jgi:hypothetical protein
MIISTGGYEWADDVLPGIAVQVGPDAAMSQKADWEYVETEFATVGQFLDSPAMYIRGARIRRRDIVTYIANKKAAHVSESRKRTQHDAIDKAWSTLGITIARDDGGGQAFVSVVYLELMSIVRSIARSPDVEGFLRDVSGWLATAVPYAAEAEIFGHIGIRIEPTKRGS